MPLGRRYCHSTKSDTRILRLLAHGVWVTATGPCLGSSFNSSRKPFCIAPAFLHVPLLLKLGQSELPSNIWLYFVFQCLLTFPRTTQPHADASARPSLAFADLLLSLPFNLSLSSGKVRLRQEVTWPRSSRRWVANVGTETTALVTIR